MDQVLLLLVYLASFHAYYRERIEALGIGVPLVLYLGMFAMLAVALVLAAFTRPGWLRWVLALAFTISAIFLDAYNRITDSYLTYSAFVSMVYAGSFVRRRCNNITTL